MKKIRTNIDQHLDRLARRWQTMPINKQHKYILYFFVGYFLLSAGVIGKVWYDTGTTNDVVIIRHIENPVFEKRKEPAGMQDTLTTTQKNKFYERQWK